MKAKLARDQWWNATETLKEATVLATCGQYKGAISRAFFAMEHAARAALAVKDQEPKTHRGMVQAFNNQLVRTGEMDRDRGESLEDAQQARNTADYGSFYRATAHEAYQVCAHQVACRLLLDETRATERIAAYAAEHLPANTLPRNAVTEIETGETGQPTTVRIRPRASGTTGT